jgi:hypothetical protein
MQRKCSLREKVKPNYNHVFFATDDTDFSDIMLRSMSSVDKYIES